MWKAEGQQCALRLPRLAALEGMRNAKGWRHPACKQQRISMRLELLRTLSTHSGRGTCAVSPTLAPQAWKLITACSLRPMRLATRTKAR